VVAPIVLVPGSNVRALSIEGEVVPVKTLVVRISISLAGAVTTLIRPNTPTVLTNQARIAETASGTLRRLENGGAVGMECVACLLACSRAVGESFIYWTVLVCV